MKLDTEIKKKIVSNWFKFLQNKICEEFKINEIDFLKIDIEGAEPLLDNSLNILLPNIKSMLVEFSDKNSFELYNR